MDQWVTLNIYIKRQQYGGDSLENHVLIAHFLLSHLVQNCPDIQQLAATVGGCAAKTLK